MYTKASSIKVWEKEANQEFENLSKSMRNAMKNTQQMIDIMEQAYELNLDLSHEELEAMESALSYYVQWHHPLFDDVSKQKETLKGIIKILQAKLGR